MPGRGLFFCIAAALAALAGCAEGTREGARNSDIPEQHIGQAVASKRVAMVREQIEARGIDDPRVLAALETVPRHLFVPEEVRSQAYRDSPLPIGHDQTISQPYIVAIMTSLLDLNESDRVLEIGTGSGYQAAILAEIIDSVYTIEIIEPLGRRAERTLVELGYDRVRVRIGDGYGGWPEAAPFDGIIVTCAPRDIPAPLIEQLAERGRMVIPYGDPWFQELVLVEKTGGDIRKTSILPVRFVPLTGSHGGD